MKHSRPVIISTVFPSALQRNKSAEKVDLAYVNILHAALLHDKCTLPGSVVLRNSYLRTVVIEKCGMFLTSGLLVLDRRAECSSFQDLASAMFEESPGKIPKAEREAMLRSASSLDQLNLQVVGFNGSNTSREFRNLLQGFLNSIDQSALSHRQKNSIASIRELMAKNSKILHPADVDRALRGSKNAVSGMIRAFAEYAYATLGAKVLDADVQLPRKLTIDAFALPKDASGAHGDEMVSTRPKPRFLVDIHCLILKKLYIDGNILASVGPKAILDLKEVAFFKQSLGEMKKIEDHMLENSQKDGGEIEHLLADHAKLRSELEKHVEKVLRKDFKRFDRASAAGDFLDVGGEILDVAVDASVPLSGTARKAASVLSHTILRKSVLARSTSPIRTYVQHLTRRFR